MMSPGTGVTRFVRAAVLGTLVLVLTLSAHRVGGGETPGLAGIGALVLVTWPLALLATRRRLRPLALVTGLGAGQLAGHALLEWLGGAGGASVAVGCLQQATHHVAQHVGSGGCLGETVAATATAHASAHASVPSGPGIVMVSAHVVATVLAALLVARGEQVLWRVVDLVVRGLAVLVAPVQLRPGQAAAALLVPTRADLYVRTGRGPPAYAA